MAERATEQVDETLQRDAVERLLEWGFSTGDIAETLGQSEVWVREVQEARPTDGSRRTTNPESSTTDHTTRDERRKNAWQRKRTV